MSAEKDDPDQPEDVLDRDDLDYEAKLGILQRWQAELRQEGEDRHAEWLRRIEEAIERLQTEVTLDPEKPKEAPSGKGYRPED